MNRTQIAKIYDSFPSEEQDMPRGEFIKRMATAMDPNKMMAEANMMAQGRIQKAVIDSAITRGNDAS
jgi:hypothetical protein